MGCGGVVGVSAGGVGGGGGGAVIVGACGGVAGCVLLSTVAGTGTPSSAKAVGGFSGAGGMGPPVRGSVPAISWSGGEVTPSTTEVVVVVTSSSVGWEGSAWESWLESIVGWQEMVSWDSSPWELVRRARPRAKKPWMVPVVPDTAVSLRRQPVLKQRQDVHFRFANKQAQEGDLAEATAEVQVAWREQEQQFSLVSL